MSYLAVVLILGLLILAHEAGHLLAAKLCGIPVRQFSLGFGPKLLEIRRGETSYRLSCIPIGGYVLPGLDPEEFQQLPMYARIGFALGGPAANIVAAFVGLFILALAEVGQAGAGSAVRLAGTGLLTGLGHQIGALSLLFENPAHLSGIVGIVAVGGAQFGATAWSLLTFSVGLNLSLAVMNLLPLPPLDGGRILFAILEKLHRPITRVEGPLTLAGWMVVFGLMLYVTVQDVGRIVA